MLDQIKWVPWPAAPDVWVLYEEKLPDGMWMTVFKRPDDLQVNVERPEQNNIYLSREPFDTHSVNRDRVWESPVWDPMMLTCIILDIRAEHGVANGVAP